MPWLSLILYFIGGAFLANAIPHVVSGMTGRSFQTPFARPPGQGLSSSTVNVLWGFANLFVGYALVWRVGHFDPQANLDVLALGAGALLIAILSAWHFGRFHSGEPERP